MLRDCGRMSLRMLAIVLAAVFACSSAKSSGVKPPVEYHSASEKGKPSIDLADSRRHGVRARDVQHQHESLSSLKVGLNHMGLGQILGEDKKEDPVSEEEKDKKKEAKEDKKEVEEEKKKEEGKVDAGVEVMTEEEQSTTILRCRQEDEVMDPKDVNAPNVSVGIYVTNLGSTDGLVSGVYFAEFLFYLQQDGEPLSEFEGRDPIEQLGFSNAKSFTYKSYGAGTYLVSGDFFFSPDLRWYPFDQQDLRIVAEQMESPITEWDFVPSNSNGLSPSVRFPGWLSSLKTVKTASKAPCFTSAGVKVYPGGSRADPESMNNVTYSKFSYTLTLERPVMQGLLTHVMPPIVVFLPTLYSYALDPVKDAITKMSLSGGGLISLIFIWRGISGSLPALDYLTGFDKYIFCFFVSISVALSFSIGTYANFAHRSGSGASASDLREMLSEVSTRVCFWSVVLIFFVFLPLWMFIDPVIMMPCGLLLLVVGCLWCYNEFEEIKLSYDPQELSGLEPKDVRLED